MGWLRRGCWLDLFWWREYCNGGCGWGLGNQAWWVIDETEIILGLMNRCSSQICAWATINDDFPITRFIIYHVTGLFSSHCHETSVK